MARYKDVEGYRKLFDEEYKKTRQLISEGETHLDNLAEGFIEAGRVIDRMPTADVVPKSEVARLQQGEYRHIGKTLVNARNEAIEDFAEKLKEIKIKYALPLLGLQTKDEIERYVDDILLQMRDGIDSLVKEMTGEKSK